MASDKVVHLNQANFKDVTDGDQPVLVDFWASWCQPCLRVAPVLDELADELAGKLTIAKVNLDENQDLAMRFQVQSIPTFILFRKGEVIGRMMGAMHKAAFERFIETNLETVAA